MSPVALLQALRPHQWVKNVFVLAALVFRMAEVHAAPSERLGDLRKVLFAFFAFCLAASAMYLVNDVVDVESDRRHPTKRLRPVAAGRVRVPAALGLAAACFLGALGLSWLASTSRGNVTLVVAGYMALNLLYSTRLKHVAILDAFCIASGFILRVVAGGFAAQAPLSHWVILCTLFLALFLALCKRRAEIDLLGDGRGEHRRILLEYTPVFLDQSVTVLAACTILTYTMYTVSYETADKFGDENGLVLTVPFVVFGLFRYLLLVSTQRGGGNPTRVLLGGDAIFVLNCLAWLGTVVALLFT